MEYQKPKITIILARRGIMPNYPSFDSATTLDALRAKRQDKARELEAATLRTQQEVELAAEEAIQSISELSSWLESELSRDEHLRAREQAGLEGFKGEFDARFNSHVSSVIREKTPAFQKTASNEAEFARGVIQEFLHKQAVKSIPREAGRLVPQSSTAHIGPAMLEGLHEAKSFLLSHASSPVLSSLCSKSLPDIQSALADSSYTVRNIQAGRGGRGFGAYDSLFVASRATNARDGLTKEEYKRLEDLSYSFSMTSQDASHELRRRVSTDKKGVSRFSGPEGGSLSKRSTLSKSMDALGRVFKRESPGFYPY